MHQSDAGMIICQTDPRMESFILMDCTPGLRKCGLELFANVNFAHRILMGENENTSIKLRKSQI